MSHEASYRAIIENFPNGLIALYDHDLRYTLIDGEGLAAIGLRPEDLKGKRLRDVFPPDVYQRDEPHLLAALRGEKTESWVQFAGQHFRVLTVPVRDAEGAVILGLVMSQNVTEAMLVQERLRASNDKLELAVASAKLGIWELDLSTHALKWNDELLAMYGITREEFSANVDGWRELVHPEDLAHADHAFGRITMEGSVHDVAFRVRQRRTGATRHVHASGAVRRNERGEPVALIGINIDVTRIREVEEERRRLDARLRQAQKLEALGALAGGVAHDLNNLLQVIIGQTEEARITSGEAQLAALGDVLEASARARRLVSQLLDIGRRELVAPAPVDLVAAVRSSLTVLRPLLGSGIDVDFRPPSAEGWIVGELVGVEQVIMNLCLNARDAMPAGGTLRIEVGQAPEDTTAVQLTVSDTGAGIAPEHLDRIFDPFFTTKGSRGTGLGLATVHGIVSRHRGSVTVDSEVGRGTVIRTTWPAADAGAAASPPTLG